MAMLEEETETPPVLVMVRGLLVELSVMPVVTVVVMVSGKAGHSGGFGAVCQSDRAGGKARFVADA